LSMKAKSKKAPKDEPSSPHLRPRIYDSIQQCSAAEAIPASVLKWAKKKGCPAFDHSRVNVRMFNEWFHNQGEVGKNWKEEYEEYRAKREKHKFKREDGECILTDDAIEAGKELFGILQKVFGMKHPSELPSRLRGLDDLAMRKILMDAYEQGLKECKQAFDERLEKGKGIVEEPELAT